MKATRTTLLVCLGLGLSMGIAWWAISGMARVPAAPPSQEKDLRQLLDAPLLFVKRHSYTGIHIYDTFYKWPPGGGGIYIIENPSAPRAEWKVRPVIDPTTPETLGIGVYSHPELSWDAQKLLFCFKGEARGNTSIHEIGIDGRGLRRLTDPSSTCDCYKGNQAGQHDTAPAYLPDGRIVFLSTRLSGLVPCNNTGVAILHVMNADGSDIHPISVNNVNEFDPAVLPDGRILFGRWEYVDKNALTIQSLWTINPDGTQETAVFANNMVFPEAILDARPVPGSQLIVGTLAKHNAPPRGSIAFIDSRRGKNNPAALANLEHPEDPTHDRGDSCEPWPLSEDVVLFSGRPRGQARNVLEMIDRSGHRQVLHAEPDICLHSPMLVKPRPRPPILRDSTDRKAKSGSFFVQDIYQGLTGVKRGEVKWLRVIEETSRVSGSPGGSQPYNQTFLVSAALAFSVKNYLGVVPVSEDGSAHFEVPAGRAVYFQALDAEGRLIQSMRTFVQAAPGTTRSCIGCHEHKFSAPDGRALREALQRKPLALQPESWGSGYVDYPSMVQPILDRHCALCHGGTQGIAAGIDLTGGWTEHFSISYENLVNRCETQLVAYWIAGIDCMNGTAHWSSQLFPPRSHGSGAAPLATLLTSGHGDRIPNLSRKERDLLMAWIDTNGLYHGTWDYTENGCAIKNWNATRQALAVEMQAAGCMKCHGDGKRPTVIENDWINLKEPALSRILRAPLAPGQEEGHGLGLCRDRKADRTRLRLLWNGYAHAVQPVDRFARVPFVPAKSEGDPVVSFASQADPHYRNLLAIIRRGRDQALASPRVDMPGADVVEGACRHLLPPSLPATPPALDAALTADGLVEVSWERSGLSIGLKAELHRGSQAQFEPTEETLLIRTTRSRYTDRSAPPGKQHYAVVLASGSDRTRPVYRSLTVPPPARPPAPTGLKATPASHGIRLQWQAPGNAPRGYHVYRAIAGENGLQRITHQPVRQTAYIDTGLEVGRRYVYSVRALSQRGAESEPTASVTATPIVIQEPVFEASFARDIQGLTIGKESCQAQGNARINDGSLTLKPGAYLRYAHRDEFEAGQPFTVECWVRFDQAGQMPVLVSCGVWNQAGWFLQRLGSQWRWHVAGIDCDGGKPIVGSWIHLAATFDGKTARLFENGVKIAEKSGPIRTDPWPGDLFVGQYSGQPGPEYQVVGSLAGLKIYHRAVTPKEIETASRSRSK